MQSHGGQALQRKGIRMTTRPHWQQDHWSANERLRLELEREHRAPLVDALTVLVIIAVCVGAWVFS